MVTAEGKAPDFTLPGLDGLRYALHESLDKGPLLLAFWQAECGACRMSAPYWNRLYGSYENAGWSFWAIGQDAEEAARRFAAAHELRPTVLVDGPELAVSDAYDPDETPTLYLIAPDGTTELVTSGFDKDGLNDISRRIAGWTGAEYVEVAADGDGNPRFRPG